MTAEGTIEQAAREVSQAFLDPRTIRAWESLSNRGGFSGAQLWRIETAYGQFCLRAWPTGRPADEIAQIHQLMRQAATGLPFVPHVWETQSGGSVVEKADRRWELTTWMPGRANFCEHPTRGRLRAALEALAALHKVWANRGAEYRQIPAVLRRLHRLADWEQVRPARIELAFREQAGGDLVHLAHRAWEQLLRWIKPARFALEPWADRRLPCQFCLCDIWHDHVLFHEDQVTGMIDYGSVRQDNIATDLARLLGSLLGDDKTQFEAGLDAYDASRRISPEERRLARLLDWTGVVVGAGNWIRWLYLQELRFDNIDGVTKRLSELVNRLEGWRRPPSDY